VRRAHPGLLLHLWYHVRGHSPEFGFAPRTAALDLPSASYEHGACAVSESGQEVLFPGNTSKILMYADGKRD